MRRGGSPYNALSEGCSLGRHRRRTRAWGQYRAGDAGGDRGTARQTAGSGAQGSRARGQEGAPGRGCGCEGRSRGLFGRWCIGRGGARVMKMADGGFRPAYNVQFATDTKSTAIAGVSVDNIGSDMGKMLPMNDALAGQYGTRPRQHLADGGFAKLDDIEALAQNGVETFVPVPKPRNARPAPFRSAAGRLVRTALQNSHILGSRRASRGGRPMTSDPRPPLAAVRSEHLATFPDASRGRREARPQTEVARLKRAFYR